MLFVRRSLKSIMNYHWKIAKDYHKQGLFVYGNDTIFDTKQLADKNKMLLVPICCEFTKKLENFITINDIETQLKFEYWLDEEDRKILDNISLR